MPSAEPENEPTLQELIDAYQPSKIRQRTVVTIEPDMEIDGIRLAELITMMFVHPEYDYHVYHAYKTPLQQIFTKQNAVLLDVAEPHYYKLPELPRSYTRSGPNDKVPEDTPLAQIVKAGPMYVRTTLKLAAWKIREMEIAQHIDAAKDANANPLEVKPGMFGISVDVLKLPRYAKSVVDNVKQRRTNRLKSQ